MAQQFIVEGNDGYVLSALCGKVGLPIPVGGYEGKKYGKFVVDAGGISKLSDAIRIALANTSNTNIGVVIDANGAGVPNRVNRTTPVIPPPFPYLHPL